MWRSPPAEEEGADACDVDDVGRCATDAAECIAAHLKTMLLMMAGMTMC